jgi:tetratricopeptide (TPR) repeat protein
MQDKLRSEEQSQPASPDQPTRIVPPPPPPTNPDSEADFPTGKTLPSAPSIPPGRPDPAAQSWLAEAATVHSEPPCKPPAEDSPLPSIPGYEILRVLGRGGMGVVYEARDTRLPRRVALKMIVAGIYANPIQLARFRFEAEILASLQHPHIVGVYEVGEHDECPYLALEFVEGGSLDQYLHGQSLPVAAAARLVELLARAMHAAHQRGIIHRDLKPGNILLQSGESLVPKVSDFGLARRLEGSDQTASGAVLGTPAYMAPEQAGGRTRLVGPASDIYALGVILYECLTGQVPFRGETPVETLNLVLSQEPRPPRAVTPGRIPRDLETIVLKCLDKVPGRRYASAADLAEDLRRFLAGEPILARPVGLVERGWKWARRRPTAAALWMVSLAALLALAGLGWSYHIHVRAARDRAEQRSRLARRAVDDIYTRVAEEWLGEEASMDDLKRQFLARALAIYEELAQDEGNDPALRQENGRAWFRMGQIYRQLGRHPEAEEAYRQAIERQSALVKQDPHRAELRSDLAASHNGLGELLRSTARLEEARQNYRQARLLLEESAVETPADPSWVQELARSWYNDGLALAEQGQLEPARQACEQAIVLLEPITWEAAPPGPRQDLARAQLNLGTLLRRLGKPQEALSAYQGALQQLDGLLEQAPGKPEYRHEKAVCHLNLGNLAARELKQPQRARVEYDQARTLLDKLTHEFPARPTYQEKLANLENSLGALAVEEKQNEEAERHWKESARLFEQMTRTWKDVPRHQHDLGMVQGNLGWLCLRRFQQPERARTCFQESIRHLEAARQRDPNNPELHRTLIAQWQYLAETELARHDEPRAARAVEQMLGLPGLVDPDRFNAAGLLARCAALAGSPTAGGTLEERSRRQQTHADAALRLLHAIDPRREPRLQGLGNNKDFASLRDQRSFRDLMARLKSPGSW